MAEAAKQPESVPMGGVPSTEIMKVWACAEPMLERVVTRDTGHTMLSVLNGLQTASMQLWVIGDFQGIAVTELQNRPAERVLFTLFLVGSNMKEWIDDLHDLLESFAQHNGCAALEFNGRKGWNKLGEKRPEWKAVRTVFRQEF